MLVIYMYVILFTWCDDGGDIFSARDRGRGEAAVAALQQEGLHPKFHQLDITDTDSIRKLADYLKDNYGGLDVLVNNAAIAYKVSGPVSGKILSQEMDLCSLITLATIRLRFLVGLR